MEFGGLFNTDLGIGYYIGKTSHRSCGLPQVIQEISVPCRSKEMMVSSHLLSVQSIASSTGFQTKAPLLIGRYIIDSGMKPARNIVYSLFLSCQEGKSQT